MDKTYSFSVWASGGLRCGIANVTIVGSVMLLLEHAVDLLIMGKVIMKNIACLQREVWPFILNSEHV